MLILKSPLASCLPLLVANSFPWSQDPTDLSGVVEPTCHNQTATVMRLRVTQRWVESEKKCMLMVSLPPVGETTRSFVFNNYGMLLTFNAFGKGPVSRNTGARTHFILPVVQPLRMEIRDRKLYVYTSSGHVATFDAYLGRLQGISGGVFRVSQIATPRNGGGVTLRLRRGIVIDHGFMRGESPHSKPNRVAKIIDANGRQCKVKNKRLFFYKNREPKLRFSSARQLSAFFRGRHGMAADCVSLTVVASKGRSHARNR